MNPPHSPLDRLAASILSQPRRSRGGEPSRHLDDDALAAFSLGTASDETQQAVVAHLAECDTCRRIAAAAMSELEEEEEEEEKPVVPLRPPTGKRAIIAGTLALAASVLLAVSLKPEWLFQRKLGEAEYYARALERLEGSDFAEAERLTGEAVERGAGSPRIHNLRAQAMRRIPNASALAYGGRLSDFGFELGGVTRRDAAAGADTTAVTRELAAAGDDPAALLNRGHLALAANRFGEAERLFADAARRDPASSEARLGLGLTQYMSGDFAGAEQSFAEILKSHPEHRAAAWNRAMTLEELGRFAEAVDAWRPLQSRSTDAEERRQLERHLERLESGLRR
jgi:tetratricopeptide (TPR) repeat protein